MRLWMVLLATLTASRAMETVAAEPFACGQAATPLSAVQGQGPVSPLQGHVVDIEAVVVGAFQQPGQWGGVFVQEEEEDQDDNPDTSEALFIHTRKTAKPGDLLRARGTVTEFEGLTELHPVTETRVCSRDNPLPPATVIRLPLASPEALEALENMRVRLPQAVTVIETRNLAPYGELLIASERLYQPTEIVAPGRPAAGMARDNSLDRLIVDDGHTGRDKPIRVTGRDGQNPFAAVNPIRSGYRVSDLEGVLHYAFGGYRLQPTSPVVFDASANPRSSRPDPVGGNLRISTFNVLNFFSTLDEGAPHCGPRRDQNCRGAKGRQEQMRQLDKIAAALTVINADVIGLLELENNDSASLGLLVDGLNAKAETPRYAYVPTGVIGNDAIKVGLLYQPERVSPEGPFAVLDHRIDPGFDDSLSRPALAQTFSLNDDGGRLTVVVAHLKSKGCTDARGPNGDLGDGQSCYNRARIDAAGALARWALADPTGTGAEAVLVVGDFNSYRREDPLRAMRETGLVDLLDRTGARQTYTYVYDGLAGSLDHAFGNLPLLPFVSGATVWHINSDEAAVLEYRLEPGKPADYHDPGPFRSSDHDPVIVGLSMGQGVATRENTDSTVQPEPAGTHYFLKFAVVLMLVLFAITWYRRKR